MPRRSPIPQRTRDSGRCTRASSLGSLNCGRGSSRDGRNIAGHSLGAARASLFTGLMVLDGKPPVRRLCFGEPRPGFPQAAGIIANVRSRSYRNANGRAHDLVTDVPFTSWIEDYVHPTPLVPICAPPSDADVQRDIFFAWHAMRLYASATPDIPIV